MRFSFCVIPTQTVQQVGDLVQRAEAWDADMVWVPDEAFMRDPYVLLGAVASRTSKVGLGIGIANPYTRHPMQLTRAICTAADLRGGNMVFGIGAGLKSTRAAIDANEGEFVQTTRDCISIMKRLMAGETVSFDGPVFKLDKARLMFKPTQAVPIYVASTHRDAFVMAGEIADGVIVGNVAEPEAMAQVVSWVHEGALRAGRDPTSIEIVAWNIAVVDDEVERAYDIMRNVIAKSVAITHRAVRAAMNIDHDTWQAVHGAVRHGKGEITRSLVPDALIDKYAIVGSAKRCAERMRALEQAGATMMGVRTALELNAQYDWESNVRTLSAALKA